MIGRKREIEELENLYNSNDAQLVAIYGRRRVGKTYLINYVFEEKFTFKHAGLSPDEDNDAESLAKQLHHFYNSLTKYGMSKEEKEPKNWFDAFLLLEKLLETKDKKEKMVVFIDELPWMDTKKSDFIKAFEGFWNGYGCSKNNLLMIICGSATSWIENNLINNHGGLYGRVTYEIKLEPFNLHEVETFLESKNVHFSKYEIVESYMILGGIPYYLNYLDPRFSLSQNIDNLFFKKNAKLKLEFDRLFDSIFTYSTKAKEIVNFLFTKTLGYTKKEISSKLKISDGGTLSKYLNGLIASDFVIKYVPFGFSKKEEYYKLVDPFCLFYLSFVSGNIDNESYWTQNLITPKLNIWRGFAFENVCFNHVDQIKFKLGISGVITRTSAFYNKEDGYQIDLMIIRNDNVINLCELKFLSTPFKVDKDYFLKINGRVNALLPKINKKQVIKNTFISTYGLKKNEYSSVFQDSILIDDLFIF